MEYWNESTKQIYNKHILDIGFYIKSLEIDVENILWQNIIIEEAFETMQNEVRVRYEQNQNIDVDSDFRKFILDSGNRIILSYYMQNKDCYPSDVEKLNEENELIMQVSKLLSNVWTIEKANEEIELTNSRRWQVHPINKLREMYGFYKTIIPELKKYPEKFHHYTRMNFTQFDFLLDMISEKIEKCELFRKDVIPPEMRLLVTLRHLATGMDYSSIGYEYLIGRTTVHVIIPETCEAIWDLHTSYLSWPNDLEVISDGFKDKYNFPHCCGAVDGKHIRIQKPRQSGSQYYNYKNYFSIVLLAVCDADANFLYVDVGAYGSQADGNAWSHCTLGAAISAGEMNWPETKMLPNSEIGFHYFFIGDEAFPIGKHLLRPYSGRNLDHEKTYFNNRLASARNVIERTFGMFSNMFRIFRGEILHTPEHAEVIVRACTVLYNYIRTTCDGEIPNFTSAIQNDCVFEDISAARGRPNSQGNITRDTYQQYLWTHRN